MSRCLDFNYGLCVSSEWRDGALEVGVELLGSGASGRPLLPLQPLGLYARPLDPETDAEGNSGAGAGVLYAWQGDDGYAMPTTDPRAIGNVPQGPPGSTCVYASGDGITAYHFIDGDTGYHQLLVKYGAEGNEKSLSITLDTSGDQPAVTIRHGEGHGIVLTNDKKILLEASSGEVYVEINDSKVIVNGDLQVNGAVLLGGASGNKVPTETDINAIKNAVTATINSLTSQGNPVIASVPFVAVTPCSSKLSAAP